jgi:hypothetical protein
MEGRGAILGARPPRPAVSRAPGYGVVVGSEIRFVVQPAFAPFSLNRKKNV